MPGSRVTSKPARAPALGGCGSMCKPTTRLDDDAAAPPRFSRRERVVLRISSNAMGLQRRNNIQGRRAATDTFMSIATTATNRRMS